MGAIRGFDAAVNLLINPRDDIAIRFPSVNKMYEYLAAGLPILCSDIEGFQEEFVREGVAVSVNALDEASIADGLRSLVGNRARLPKMKERAVELARDRYNWATQGAQLTALYHRLAPAVSAPN
jgi:glycosyltransferase involved in cell wall biosynthesis